MLTSSGCPTEDAWGKLVSVFKNLCFSNLGLSSGGCYKGTGVLFTLVCAMEEPGRSW